MFKLILLYYATAVSLPVEMIEDYSTGDLGLRLGTKTALSRPLIPGDRIDATGFYSAPGSDFGLNIGNTDSGTVIFQLAVRPGTNEVAVMSGGAWVYKEVNVDLPAGERISISIRMLNSCFVVLINDVALLETFPYGMPLHTGDFVALAVTTGEGGMSWSTLKAPGAGLIHWVDDGVIHEEVEEGKKYPLTRALRVGDIFTCSATITRGGFSFNLRQGDHFLLHIDFRALNDYGENAFVLNNNMNGWYRDTEVRPSWFDLHGSLDLKVEVGASSYMITVNGQRLDKDFPQRDSIDKAEYVMFILHPDSQVKWSNLKLPIQSPSPPILALRSPPTPQYGR